MSLWAEIRRLHEIEKLSTRAIASRLHCSRQPTIRGRGRRGSCGDRHASEPALSKRVTRSGKREPAMATVRLHRKAALGGGGSHRPSGGLFNGESRLGRAHSRAGMEAVARL